MVHRRDFLLGAVAASVLVTSTRAQAASDDEVRGSTLACLTTLLSPRNDFADQPVITRASRADRVGMDQYLRFHGRIRSGVSPGELWARSLGALDQFDDTARHRQNFA
jgi:hypothetical protein